MTGIDAIPNLSNLSQPFSSPHGKCSGIKGSMYKVMKTFVCRDCVNPVTSTGRTSVDIAVDANLELVDKFCYLGDMLSVIVRVPRPDFGPYPALRVKVFFFADSGSLDGMLHFPGG